MVSTLITIQLATKNKDARVHYTVLTQHHHTPKTTTINVAISACDAHVSHNHKGLHETPNSMPMIIFVTLFGYTPPPSGGVIHQ